MYIPSITCSTVVSNIVISQKFQCHEQNNCSVTGKKPSRFSMSPTNSTYFKNFALQFHENQPSSLTFLQKLLHKFLVTGYKSFPVFSTTITRKQDYTTWLHRLIQHFADKLLSKQENLLPLECPVFGSMTILAKTTSPYSAIFSSRSSSSHSNDRFLQTREHSWLKGCVVLHSSLWRQPCKTCSMLSGE